MVFAFEHAMEAVSINLVSSPAQYLGAVGTLRPGGRTEPSPLRIQGRSDEVSFSGSPDHGVADDQIPRPILQTTPRYEPQAIIRYTPCQPNPSGGCGGGDDHTAAPAHSAASSAPPPWYTLAPVVQAPSQAEVKMVIVRLDTDTKGTLIDLFV